MEVSVKRIQPEFNPIEITLRLDTLAEFQGVYEMCNFGGAVEKRVRELTSLQIKDAQLGNILIQLFHKLESVRT